MLLKKYHINEKPYAEKKLIYISRKKARLRQTINEKSFNLELTKRRFATFATSQSAGATKESFLAQCISNSDFCLFIFIVVLSVRLDRG
jgi:hypothetical protein